MALWTDDGTGLHKVFPCRVDQPAPAFLCCPGPSLAAVKEDLRGPGRIVYALNSAYPKIKPDVWIGLDRLACHHPRVWFEPFAKITRFLKGDTEKVRNCPNVFYADMDEAPLVEMFFRRQPETTFTWEHSSFLFALHYLYWLGHKHVYLVGCDMGGPKDYHDDRVLPDEFRLENAKLHDRQVALLRELTPLARRHGLAWTSCTQESRLNSFLPFVPLQNAIDQCTAGMPDTRPLIHSIEADDLAEGKRCAPAAPEIKSRPRWAAQAMEKLLSSFSFKSVLDVGAGQALEHSRSFCASGKLVTAVDHQRPSEVPSGVRFFQSDFTSSDSKIWNKKFDCVWCSHVLEHQRNPGMIIDRMLGSLKSGGVLAITVPPMTPYILGGHVSVWNLGLLCYHLVSAGLDLRGATLINHEGNLSVIAKKKMFDTSKLGLRFDKGDIEKLSPYFPAPGLAQGFDGRTMTN